MKKYKVVGYSNTTHVVNVDYRYADASALKEEFGLPHSIYMINHLWSDYSDKFAAGWLVPEKEEVESVFGVILEEV